MSVVYNLNNRHGCFGYQRTIITTESVCEKSDINRKKVKKFMTQVYNNLVKSSTAKPFTLDTKLDTMVLPLYMITVLGWEQLYDFGRFNFEVIIVFCYQPLIVIF